MNVPSVVKNAAYPYGHKLDYMGKYEGKDAYEVAFPDDAVVGFPIIFLYDGVHVKKVIDADFVISNSFVKDFEEDGVE